MTQSQGAAEGWVKCPVNASYNFLNLRSKLDRFTNCIQILQRCIKVQFYHNSHISVEKMWDRSLTVNWLVNVAAFSCMSTPVWWETMLNTVKLINYHVNWDTFSENISCVSLQVLTTDTSRDNKSTYQSWLIEFANCYDVEVRCTADGPINHPFFHYKER